MGSTLHRVAALIHILINEQGEGFTSTKILIELVETSGSLCWPIG